MSIIKFPELRPLNSVARFKVLAMPPELRTATAIAHDALQSTQLHYQQMRQVVNIPHINMPLESHFQDRAQEIFDHHTLCDRGLMDMGVSSIPFGMSIYEFSNYSEVKIRPPAEWEQEIGILFRRVYRANKDWLEAVAATLPEEPGFVQLHWSDHTLIYGRFMGVMLYRNEPAMVFIHDRTVLIVGSQGNLGFVVDPKNEPREVREALYRERGLKVDNPTTIIRDRAMVNLPAQQYRELMEEAIDDMSLIRYRPERARVIIEEMLLRLEDYIPKALRQSEGGYASLKSLPSDDEFNDLHPETTIQYHPRFHGGSKIEHWVVVIKVAYNGNKEVSVCWVNDRLELFENHNLETEQVFTELYRTLAHLIGLLMYKTGARDRLVHAVNINVVEGARDDSWTHRALPLLFNPVSPEIFEPIPEPTPEPTD